MSCKKQYGFNGGLGDRHPVSGQPLLWCRGAIAG